MPQDPSTQAVKFVLSDMLVLADADSMHHIVVTCAAVRRSPGVHVTALGCLAVVGDGACNSGLCRKVLPALKKVCAAHRLVQLCRVHAAH